MNTVATYQISHSDPSVQAAFAAAIDAFHSYLGDPLEPLEPLREEHPDFVMGHLFRAVVLLLTSERRFLAPARASLEAAEALIGHANERERGITAALRPLVAGDWETACRRLDHVLIDHPTDAFTLQTAHLMDFFRGDALNLRNRVARVLPAWSAGMPGYSFVLGMHAFGLEECNQYPEAERAGRTALEMDPRDAWAVHAVTHVMEMQGRVNDGIEWLERRRADWAPATGPANGFAYHNWWHLALFHLDRGGHEEALRILDTAISPGAGDLSLGLLDVTALLWRLKLLGVPIGDRFETPADHWEAKLDQEGGYYAFNDFHAALAFAATDRGAAFDRVRDAQERAAGGEPGAGRDMAAGVGVPLLRALQDYRTGHYADAAQKFGELRDGAVRFGGSHAQRDLITLTLIDAARRGGETALARHYLNERLSAKPQSGLGWRLLAGL